MWGPNFGPPFVLSLFSSFLLLPSSHFFHHNIIHLLPPLDFSSPYHFFSKKKIFFSKLLNLPSLVSLNIFLDPCVLEHFCHTPIFGETHFQTHLFFAPTCILPMDFLFLLFMARNMIQHLIGMIRRGSFKTHAPYSHMDIKVNFFFGYFVWKNVVSCFIESLMVRHCHFVVCSCWNLGHFMVDHAIMLALEHVWIVVFLVMV